MEGMPRRRPHAEPRPAPRRCHQSRLPRSRSNNSASVPSGAGPDLRYVPRPPWRAPLDCQPTIEHPNPRIQFLVYPDRARTRRCGSSRVTVADRRAGLGPDRVASRKLVRRLLLASLVAVVATHRDSAAAGQERVPPLSSGQVSPPFPLLAPSGNFTQIQTATIPYTVPLPGGVITGWSHIGTPEDESAGSGRLQVWRQVGMTNDFVLVGRSDLESFTAGVLNPFATRVPVSGGEILGLRSENAGSTYGGGSGDNVLELAGGDPAPGETRGAVGPRSQKPSSTSPPSSKPTRTATASAMRPRISARPTPPRRGPAQPPLPPPQASKLQRSRSARRSSRARQRQRSARSASRRLRSSRSRQVRCRPRAARAEAGFVVVSGHSITPSA